MTEETEMPSPMERAVEGLRDKRSGWSMEECIDTAKPVVSALLSDEEAMVEAGRAALCLLPDGAYFDCRNSGSAKHPECLVAAIVAHLLGEPTT